MNDPQINFGRTRQFISSEIADRVSVDVPGTNEIGENDGLILVWRVEPDATTSVATPTGSMTVQGNRITVASLPAGWSTRIPAVGDGQVLWSSLAWLDASVGTTNFTAPRKAGQPVAQQGIKGASVWLFFAKDSNSAGTNLSTPDAYTADPSADPVEPAGWTLAQPALSAGEYLFHLLVRVNASNVATPLAFVRTSALDGTEGEQGARKRSVYLKTFFLASRPATPSDYTYTSTFVAPTGWQENVPVSARNERVWAVDIEDDNGNVTILGAPYVIKDLDVNRMVMLYNVRLTAAGPLHPVGGSYNGLTFTVPTGDYTRNRPVTVQSNQTLYQYVVILGRSVTPEYSGPMEVAT